MIEEEAVRRSRLKAIEGAGGNPYPSETERTHEADAFLSRFEELDASQETAVLVGRAKTVRKHGGLTFAQLEDGTATVQIVLRRDVLGEEAYQAFHDTVDMGDFLEVQGKAFVTKKGERSLDAGAYRVIAKTLLPMPEKWHGLTDTEIRYRQRYLDLMVNPHVRAIFRTRAAITQAIRDFMLENGFLEVDTPILQPLAGGANARPFVTHHNALDADMYLRIAPELYLKRCLVGGFERVFEIARCFRNEGIDHAHNPEFTQIEGYAAYMDYKELMNMLEELLVRIVKAAGHDPASVPFEGQTLDFSGNFERMTFRDAILAHAKLDIEDYPDRDAIAEQALKLGVPVAKTDGHGTILDNIYKHFVRPKLIQPTFITDHPVELSPLAKRKPEDSRYTERFQLVYGPGVELINAFSELNDPIDQESRFSEQEAARQAGDEEAQRTDADFLNALKHGMPPAAGFGIGIDRLTATLVDAHSLKEVILFPTLKPEREG